MVVIHDKDTNLGNLQRAVQWWLYGLKSAKEGISVNNIKCKKCFAMIDNKNRTYLKILYKNSLDPPPLEHLFQNEANKGLPITLFEPEALKWFTYIKKIILSIIRITSYS